MALLSPESFAWVIVVLGLVVVTVFLGKLNRAQHSVAPKTSEKKRKKTSQKAEPVEEEVASPLSSKAKKKAKKQAAREHQAPKQKQVPKSNGKSPSGPKNIKHVERKAKAGGVRDTEGGALPTITQQMAARKSEDTGKKKKVDLSHFHPYFSNEKKSREPAGIALQFGLLYRGTEYSLEGCINDLNNVRTHFLTQTGVNFLPKNIILMTDDTKETPTKRNMEAAMKQLVANSVPGDRLFLQYSGHGTEVKDKGGDEKDGFDEALCPLDGGVIVDDWIFLNIVKGLEKKKGASLFVLIDACHSGTGLDLSHQYFATRGKKPAVRVSIDKKPNRTSTARVIGFAAAMDNQTATDIQGDTIPQGAFTEMFLKVFKQHQSKPLTYRQFLLAVDGLLAANEYAQQASISTTEKLDLDQICRFWDN
jgi:hypothetical protein